MSSKVSFNQEVQKAYRVFNQSALEAKTCNWVASAGKGQVITR